MAPRNPPGTPRINTGSDKGYKCTNTKCQLTHLDLDAVNVDDWTCAACNKPVYVKKINSADREILVRRVRARDVKEGKDQVYWGFNFDLAHLATTSKKAEGKINGFKWKLILEGDTTRYLMPDEYVNIV